MTDNKIDYSNAAVDVEPEDGTKDAKAWPILHHDALVGLVGEIVTAADPYTEADKVGVLLHLLANFAAHIGPTYDGPAPFVMADRPQSSVIHALAAGPTSTGKKGTAASVANQFFNELLEPPRLLKSLSTGEGLIEFVKDRQDDDDAKKSDDDKREEQDKRVLVVCEEYAEVLARASRDGSTLSGVLRDCWDGSPLHVPNRHSPLRATRHHIVIVGHITPGEFIRKVKDADMDGGSYNRMLLVLIRQSKKIRSRKGTRMPRALLADLQQKVAAAVLRARSLNEVDLTEDADALYEASYDAMVPMVGEEGRVAKILTRGRPQVLRLALLYALFDSAEVIDESHLRAALAFWDYCARSAHWFFGQAAAEEQDADWNKLVAFLLTGKKSRTEIRVDLFQKNKKAADIDGLISPRISDGTIIRTEESTEGAKKKTTFYEFSVRGLRLYAVNPQKPTLTSANGNAETPRPSDAESYAFHGACRDGATPGTTAYTEASTTAYDERDDNCRSEVSNPTNGVNGVMALAPKAEKGSEPQDSDESPAMELPLAEAVLPRVSSVSKVCEIAACPEPRTPLCARHQSWADKMLAKAAAPNRGGHLGRTDRQLREALPQPYPKAHEYRPVINWLVTTNKLVRDAADQFAATPVSDQCGECGHELRSEVSRACGYCTRCRHTKVEVA